MTCGILGKKGWIVLAAGLAMAACSSDGSGAKAGCEGTECDTGSESEDTGTGSGSDTGTGSGSDTGTGSESEDTGTGSGSDTGTGSEPGDTGTGSGSASEDDTGSEDTGSENPGTASQTDSGSDPLETQTEETDTGDAPIGPHGTTRGLLFTAKPSSSLAEKARLYFVNWDGTGLVDLSGEVKLDIYTPGFAGDGDDIYFVQGYDVRTVPWPVPETFEPVKLGVTGWSIDVSCRGPKMAYTSQPSDGYAVHVYTRSMNTDDERQITNYSGTLVINKPMMPTLSPSLDAVAFGLLNGDDVYDVYSSDLYLAHLGTSITIENLTKEGAVVQAKVVNRAPEWSPDGSLIAYMHVLDGVTEIRTIDPASPTTSKTTVTEIENAFGGPDVLAWAPDSQVLAVADGNNFGTIRIVTLAGVEEGRIDTGLYNIYGLSWQ